MYSTEASSLPMVVGVLHRQNESMLNCYSCPLLLEIVVLAQCLGWRRTFKYPNYTSKVAKHWTHMSKSMELCILDRGVTFLRLASFSRL